MRTINMGLNTDPYWVHADDAIRRWKASDNDSMIEYWESARIKSLHLRDEIKEIVESEGACILSWSCSGRTRHAMHASNWAEAMPEYEFEIDDNYGCVVRKRGK